MIFHHDSQGPEEAFSTFLFVEKPKLQNDGPISKLQQLLCSGLVCDRKSRHAVPDNRYLIGSAPILATQECLGSLRMNGYMSGESQRKSRPNHKAETPDVGQTFS